MFWADAKSTISYFLGPTFLGPIKLTRQRVVNMLENMFKKALKYYFGKTSGQCLSSYILEHILHPQCCKSQILEDMSDNGIIIPINVGPRK